MYLALPVDSELCLKGLGSSIYKTRVLHYIKQTLAAECATSSAHGVTYRDHVGGTTLVHVGCATWHGCKKFWESETFLEVMQSHGWWPCFGLEHMAHGMHLWKHKSCKCVEPQLTTPSVLDHSLTLCLLWHQGCACPHPHGSSCQVWPPHLVKPQGQDRVLSQGCVEPNKPTPNQVGWVSRLCPWLASQWVDWSSFAISVTPGPYFRV